MSPKYWTLPASPRQRWVSIVLLVCAATAAALLAWRHPVLLPIPSCPFLVATGFYCPGCGSLRASHHVLQGHWLDACRHNPLLVAFLPFFSLWLLAHLDTAVRGRRWQLDMPGVWGMAVAVLLTLFWFLRNLPWEIFGYLRPPS